MSSIGHTQSNTPANRNKRSRSVYLEGSVNGVYNDLPVQKCPKPLDNGELEVDSLSICTNNHNLFRTHFTGYDYTDFTEEPRKNLRNCARLVNEAIDRNNINPNKSKYTRRRGVEPNIKKLCKDRPFQCKQCGFRTKNNADLEQHHRYRNHY